MRAGQANAAQETTKANMIRKIEDMAATAYDRIIERYPAGGRKDDAVAKLKSLNRPIPVPTAEALAQSKAEEESRSDSSRMTRIMNNFHRGPDVAHATKVGEPPLEDPKPVNPADVIKTTTQIALESVDNKAAVETVKPGTGTAGVPHSETAPPKDCTAPPKDDTAPDASNSAVPASAPSNKATDKAAAGDSSSTSPAPPPTQVNDARTDSSSATPATTNPKDDSTSKKKKKKGLRKLIPFGS